MNSDSAKSGFKTFILTLSVSLIVFSVIYYLITSASKEPEAVSYEQTEVENVVADYKAGPDEEKAETPEVAGAKVTSSGEDGSAFAGLLAAGVEKDSVSKKNSAAVLAGATSAPSTTQTTTSGGTVPETGLMGITAGLLISLVFFTTGMYYIYSSPRKAALAGFEKKVLKDN